MNDWAHWFSAHGHDWIQSVGIIGGLVITALALRADTKSRRKPLTCLLFGISLNE